MQLLDTYQRTVKEIHDYFGYVEDWAVIPIDDRRDYYWHVENPDADGDVYYHPNKDVVESVDTDHDEGAYYHDTIYTQRHLPKWVYPGEDYTMISVDTHTDGNKFLAIFSNNKEVK